MTEDRMIRQATRAVAADTVTPTRVDDSVTTTRRGHGEASPSPRSEGQDGSLVTEYGLLAVIAATIAGVVMQWASQGALVSLFNALLSEARSLVGA